MYQAIAQSFTKYRDKTAICCLNKKLTYGQLEDSILRTARLLIETGLKADDVFTVCLPNIHAAASAFYAASKLGVNINMVHPLLPPKDIVRSMQKTGSKFIILMAVSYPACEAHFKEAGIKAIVANPTDFLSPVVRAIYKLKNASVLSRVPKDIPAFCATFKLAPIAKDFALGGGSDVYVHSGGTSGLPKTIVLSSAAITNLAVRATYMLSCTAEEFSRRKMLMVLPMFHGFGLCMCLHAVMLYGAETVLVPKFNATSTLKTILKHKVNIHIGVPAMYDKLFAELTDKKKQNLGFFTNLFCGGDTLTPPLHAKLNKKITDYGSPTTIMEGYGLTETVTVNCVNTVSDHKDGSVGKPLPEMSIVVLDSKNKPVPAGTEGEIAVCSDTQMSLYLGDSEETAKVFITLDGKRYLKTSDWGFFDSDGYLHFMQRMGRIYKRNGNKIFPSQIEEILMNTGLVSMCGVVMKEDKLTAFVVPSANSITRLTEILTEKCKETLPYWSVPKEFVIKSTLPLTVMNKVDYKNL